MNKQYLKYAALALTVVFVSGLSASFVAQVSPLKPNASTLQSNGGNLIHFTNPPTYDSNWADIRNKHGQFFNFTHDLNTTEALVDVVGQQSLTDGAHRLFLGATFYIDELGFNQTYGGASGDLARSVVQTGDGGYAVAGYTWSWGAGNYDFWLVKTDSAGNALWNKTYGGTGADYGRSVVQTSDGGYALAGYTTSFGAGATDFWLVKTDGLGNQVWNKTYGGANYDEAHCVVQTGDGGFALVGYTAFGAGSEDFWLVKTDSAGNALWNKTYGGTSGDVAYSVVHTSDGGYAIAGSSYNPSTKSDFWLVKTNSTGNMEWNQTYVWSDTDVARSVVQTGDGGYALAGYTWSWSTGSFNFNLWLVKADSFGTMRWSQTYGGASQDYGYSVVQTSDGGYALAGYTLSVSGSDNDFWLVKTDSAGNALWNKTYGGTSGDTANSMVQARDGGYVLAGSTSSYGAGEADFWLIKLGEGEFGFSIGLSMTGLTNSTITFYRGSADPFWSYVRVRMWLIKEPTWQYGDINQDGVVDQADLFILAQNYGVTLSGLGLGGVAAVAGVYTLKKRKHPEVA